MQSTFKHHEKKYLVTQEQYGLLESALHPHMGADKYGSHWVQNLYFDTENWDVIRTSIEKPLYKEKMRLRCYGVPDSTSHVFLELKKKYNGIVYKRRIALPAEAANGLKAAMTTETSQIGRELNFYLNATKVEKKMFLAYRRIALSGKENSYLRITFDSDIHYRPDSFDFAKPGEGQYIVPNCAIMEIKTPTSFPLWLVKILSEFKIYGTSFSKYAMCFTDYLYPHAKRREVERIAGLSHKRYDRRV